MIKNKIYVAICIILITACQSPHEDAESRLEKGKFFFEKGEYDKAFLELKSSSQSEISAETYYYLALLDEKRNNFKSMRDNLLQAVKLESNYKDARLKLAKVDLLFGELGNAQEQVKLVLIEDPGNVEANLLNATVYIRQSKFAEAFKIIDDVLIKNPENNEALLLKATLYYQSNEMSRALTLLDESLDKDNKNIQVRLFRIKINSQQNKIEAVVDDYKELIKLYPNAENYKLNLAKLYAFTDKLDEAEALLLEMISKLPQRAEPKILLLEFLNARIKQRVPAEGEKLLISVNQNAGQELKLSQWMLKNGYIDLAEKGLKQVIETEKYSKSGLLAQTLRNLKQLVAGEKISATSLTAQTLLAEIALNKTQYDVVEAKLNEVLSKNSDFVDAGLLKARLLLTQNNPDAAIDVLNKIIWIKNDSDYAYVLLGDAYAIKKDINRSRQNFKQALTVNPANIDAFMPIFKSLLLANQNEMARDYLQKALKAAPNQVVFLNQKAELDIKEKRWNDAQETIGQLVLSSTNKWETQYLQANIFQGKGQYAEAVILYEKLLEQFPDRLDSLINLARSLEAIKSRDKAISYLESHHAKHPDILPVIELLGEFYIANKDIEKAKHLFTEQLKQMPNEVALYLDLAKIESILLKSSVGARDVVLKGLEVNPDNPILLFSLASWYDQVGDKSNARKTYEHLLEIQSSNDLAINNLAVLLINYGNPEDAVKGRALAEKFKNNENPNFQDTYAWALVKTGHNNEAIKLLESILLKEPKTPEFRYHLGVAYYESGNTATAIAELKKALNLSESQHRSFFGKSDVKKILQELDHHG